MGTLFQLIFSFNNLQVYKRQLKKRCFRDCQTFLESKCSWGDDIQALPHLPSYGIFKPDPCRCRLGSFCKTNKHCQRHNRSRVWVHSKKINALRSYPVFEPIVIITRLKIPTILQSFKILTKFQIQNLFQTSASKSRQNFNLKISTKILLQILCQTTANLDQSSASTSWPNFSFKISIKLSSRPSPAATHPQQ